MSERELSGTISEVTARLGLLQKQGRVAGLRRIQLSALDNQPASVQIGETKPMVAGMNVNRAGGATNVIQYRDVGTFLKVTPRTSGRPAADGPIMLDLDLQDSRLRTPDDGVPLGAGEKGAVTAPEFVRSTLTTKLSVPSGQAIVAKGIKVDEKSQKGQSLVIVAARVVEPPARLR